MKPLVSEASISSALRSLRVLTIREGRRGLEHVEALLAIRGDNLEPVPKALVIRFRRGEMSRLILRGLRSGPMTLGEIVQYVTAERPGRSSQQVCQSIAPRLTKLAKRGLIVHEGRLWSLKG